MTNVDNRGIMGCHEAAGAVGQLSKSPMSAHGSAEVHMDLTNLHGPHVCKKQRHSLLQALGALRKRTDVDEATTSNTSRQWGARSSDDGVVADPCIKLGNNTPMQHPDSNVVQQSEQMHVLAEASIATDKAPGSAAAQVQDCEDAAQHKADAVVCSLKQQLTAALQSLQFLKTSDCGHLQIQELAAPAAADSGQQPLVLGRLQQQLTAAQTAADKLRILLREQLTTASAAPGGPTVQHVAGGMQHQLLLMAYQQLQEQCAAAESAAGQSQQQTSTLLVSQQQLQEQIQQMQVKLAEVHQKHELLETQNKQLLLDRAKQAEAYAGVHQALVQSMEQHQRTQEEHRRLCVEMAQVQEQCKSVMASAATACAVKQLGTLKLDYKQLQQQHAQLQGGYATLHSQYEQLRAEHTELLCKQAQPQAAKQSMLEKEVQNAGPQAAQLGSEEAKPQEQVVVAAVTGTDASEQHRLLVLKYDELESQHMQLQTDYEDLQEQYEQIEARCKQLAIQHDKHVDMQASQQDTISWLEAANVTAKLQENCMVTEATVQNLLVCSTAKQQQKRKQPQPQLQQQQQGYYVNEGSCSEMQAAVAQLQADYSALNQQLDAELEKKQQAQQKASLLEDQLQKLLQQQAEVQAVQADLQNVLQQNVADCSVEAPFVARWVSAAAKLQELCTAAKAAAGDVLEQGELHVREQEQLLLQHRQLEKQHVQLQRDCEQLQGRYNHTTALCKQLQHEQLYGGSTKVQEVRLKYLDKKMECADLQAQISQLNADKATLATQLDKEAEQKVHLQQKVSLLEDQVKGLKSSKRKRNRSRSRDKEKKDKRKKDPKDRASEEKHRHHSKDGGSKESGRKRSSRHATDRNGGSSDKEGDGTDMGACVNAQPGKERSKDKQQLDTAPALPHDKRARHGSPAADAATARTAAAAPPATLAADTSAAVMAPAAAADLSADPAAAAAMFGAYAAPNPGTSTDDGWANKQDSSAVAYMLSIAARFGQSSHRPIGPVTGDMQQLVTGDAVAVATTQRSEPAMAIEDVQHHGSSSHNINTTSAGGDKGQDRHAGQAITPRLPENHMAVELSHQHQETAALVMGGPAALGASASAAAQPGIDAVAQPCADHTPLWGNYAKGPAMGTNATAADGDWSHVKATAGRHGTAAAAQPHMQQLAQTPCTVSPCAPDASAEVDKVRAMGAQPPAVNAPAQSQEDGTPGPLLQLQGHTPANPAANACENVSAGQQAMAGPKPLAAVEGAHASAGAHAVVVCGVRGPAATTCNEPQSHAPANQQAPAAVHVQSSVAGEHAPAAKNAIQDSACSMPDELCQLRQQVARLQQQLHEQRIGMAHTRELIDAEYHRLRTANGVYHAENHRLRQQLQEASEAVQNAKLEFEQHLANCQPNKVQVLQQELLQCQAAQEAAGAQVHHLHAALLRAEQAAAEARAGVMKAEEGTNKAMTGHGELHAGPEQMTAAAAAGHQFESEQLARAQAEVSRLRAELRRESQQHFQLLSTLTQRAQAEKAQAAKDVQAANQAREEAQQQLVSLMESKDKGMTDRVWLQSMHVAAVKNAEALQAQLDTARNALAQQQGDATKCVELQAQCEQLQKQLAQCKQEHQQKHDQLQKQAEQLDQQYQQLLQDYQQLEQQYEKVVAESNHKAQLLGVVKGTVSNYINREADIERERQLERAAAQTAYEAAQAELRQRAQRIACLEQELGMVHSIMFSNPCFDIPLLGPPPGPPPGPLPGQAPGPFPGPLPGRPLGPLPGPLPGQPPGPGNSGMLPTNLAWPPSPVKVGQPNMLQPSGPPSFNNNFAPRPSANLAPRPPIPSINSPRPPSAPPVGLQRTPSMPRAAIPPPQPPPGSPSAPKPPVP